MTDFSQTESELEALRQNISSCNVSSPDLVIDILPSRVEFYKQGESCILVITNVGASASETWYSISVLNENSSWAIHTQGLATVQPNTTFQQQFHRWRALDWNCQAQTVN